MRQAGAPLEAILEQDGFDRNRAIEAVKEAVNENDTTRKRFELMARQVFTLFRACVNADGINDRRPIRDAINVVYKALQNDRERADIGGIIRELHKVVDASVVVSDEAVHADGEVYDISRIDFERLRQEFAKTKTPRTTVQNLRKVIEDRLHQMLRLNPLRTDFQKHYEELIERYNREKDRQTIEQSFAAMLAFVESLGEEEQRAVRAGLKNEEHLAVYDLLLKPELTPKQIARIKQVSAGLLKTLKAEKLKIDGWKEREATRSAVQVTIRDYLYDDATGLPVDSYEEDEVLSRADEVYAHVLRAYPRLPSPVYGEAG